MREINNPLVIEKYGKHITLNTNNIKDIYFLTMCNTICINITIKEFLEKEVDKQTILNWNDIYIYIYINSYLDRIEELLAKENIEIIRTICDYFNIVMSIYTVEKETYLRVILMLGKMYKKFGYFMNYSFLDDNPDSTIFGSFKGIYISQQLRRQIDYYKNSHGSINYYLNDIKYTGLIPNLYYLNYFSLFWKCIEELIFPIYKHFNEKSRYLDENHLEYNEFPQRIDDYSVKKLLESFIKEHNISK